MLDKKNIRLSCGESGLLRPLLQEDITQNYVDCINSPEVKKFLMQPNSERQSFRSIINYVQSNLDNPDTILFGIFVDQIHRGNIRLHDITTKSAFLGIAILDSHLWGRGWGSRTIQTVTEFGMHHLKIEKITAGISADNIGSIKCFEKAGYKIQTAKDFDQEIPGGLYWEYS
jgi:RimJ/RimL family protein N-acetyltransferase